MVVRPLLARLRPRFEWLGRTLPNAAPASGGHRDQAGRAYRPDQSSRRRPGREDGRRKARHPVPLGDPETYKGGAVASA